MWALIYDDKLQLWEKLVLQFSLSSRHSMLFFFFFSLTSIRALSTTDVNAVFHHFQDGL